MCENLYTTEVDENSGTLMAVEDFKICIDQGVFTDYDGYGCPVKDGMEKPTQLVYPSRIKHIPEDATHIIWYNK